MEKFYDWRRKGNRGNNGFVCRKKLAASSLLSHIFSPPLGQEPLPLWELACKRIPPLRTGPRLQASPRRTQSSRYKLWDSSAAEARILCRSPACLSDPSPSEVGIPETHLEAHYPPPFPRGRLCLSKLASSPLLSLPVQTLRIRSFSITILRAL